MKYIDSEKLIAKLTKLQFTLNASYRKPQSDNIVRAISFEYDDILSLVDSLQREQPDADLDREIIKYKVPFADEREYLNETTLDTIARHFYELGLNARKGETK